MAQRLDSTAVNCKQKFSKNYCSDPSVYNAGIKKLETIMTSLRGKHKYGNSLVFIFTSLIYQFEKVFSKSREKMKDTYVYDNRN